MKTIKEKQLVYLRWLDSAIELEWSQVSQEDTGLTEIQTVGYVVLEDDLHIQVAQSIYEDAKKYSAIMAIPKSVILERHSLLLLKRD